VLAVAVLGQRATQVLLQLRVQQTLAVAVAVAQSILVVALQVV
jgi:hypothetical protein